jgi:hypothetical protein
VHLIALRRLSRPARHVQPVAPDVRNDAKLLRPSFNKLVPIARRVMMARSGTRTVRPRAFFALGFRTIDCSLDGGFHPVSGLHPLRFVPLGLCHTDTLPSRFAHFLGEILAATRIKLFRDEILKLQIGVESLQHLP